MDAAQKTLSVLDALAADAEGATRLTDIAIRARLHRSTVHRILQRLVEHGYAHAEGDGRYVPGPRALALAGDMLRRLDPGYLAPVLRELSDEVGQTVHFALLTGAEATYLEKVEPPHSAQWMPSRVGGRIPLHCTAIGKALLAALAAGERAALLDRIVLSARTTTTLTTRDGLEAELEQVARRGFAIDDREHERDIRCVGAAVRDRRGRAIGAVSISAHALEVDLERALALGPRVMRAADQVAQALGGAAPQPAAG